MKTGGYDMDGRQTVTFTKMHGCGNDYIYIDGAVNRIPQEDKPAFVRRFSDRHFGIGGDGVIFINPAPAGESDVDFEMEMYNADGSRSEMCGNGIRCVGAYVWEHHLTDKKELTINSAGARKYLTLSASEQGGKRSTESVSVDMGAPILVPDEIPVALPASAAGEVSSPDPLLPPQVTIKAGGMDWHASCVSMGNPHAVVILTDDVDLASFPLDRIGPVFETHPVFPRRTNTEFVHIDDSRNVHMRVWERGTGETLACGTGCCATTVACALNGLTGDEVTVHVLGGEVCCRYDREKKRVFMTGPAETVFEGSMEL